MRCGKYWSEDAIHKSTKDRIQKLLDGECDDKIENRVREKAIDLKDINDFKALPLWLTCYIVYDRHSEDGDIERWKRPIEMKLLKQHSLRNPIVEQIVNETLQVVKDIWQYYGEGKENFFDEIHVELGREMKGSKADRERAFAKNQENENTNIRIKALLQELKDEGIDEVRPFSPSQQEILKLYEEGVFMNDSDIPDEIAKIRKNSQPKSSEIRRYKLWLEQGYRSPYTGEMIPLSELFTTKYEIEHIIPQSRYFDDSMSNKIICESEVNRFKTNKTAYEMILKYDRQIIDLGFGKSVSLFSKDEYEEHIKRYFKKNRTKMEKLLSEDIPEGFINRQLNDSRYISKVVKALLSNVVREENEQEATSKNIVTLTGSITSKLKHDWGLNDVWNSIITPRFDRLNSMSAEDNKGALKDSKGNSFGEWKTDNGNRYFQISVPSVVGKGFSKKRIDHRHHTLDALVIACTTKDHVSYITSLNTERKNYSLVGKLRVQENFNGRPIAKNYHKPWSTFTENVREALFGTVVSFKQNKRVINKTKNYYQKWHKNSDGVLKKVVVTQEKGDNWAIRKPLHKETVYGRVNLQLVKQVSLAKGLENWESIKDRPLRNKIKALFAEGKDVKAIKTYFKKDDNFFEGKEIKKLDIYYYDDEYVASRCAIDDTFDSKKIASITDEGIQTLMLKHLKKYNTIDAKGIMNEQPDLAFSQDGLDVFNANLDGHKPIYKLRTYEPKGKKFNVGDKGINATKYVVAAKGTNLFFAVYSDAEKNRTFASIPLNEVIERQKQGVISVPERDEKGNDLLFILSPNDLVYLPTEDEENNPSLVDFSSLSKEQIERIYKVVSFSGNRLSAIQNTVAKVIVDKVEYTVKNKLEISLDNQSIKQVCWKLAVDRLGNIISVEK
jgi:CRISPR-associated endonuclease Csn1